MPIGYNRSIGASVYDPSGGPNEADQGNAINALAMAFGFTNEASDLGKAAAFGGMGPAVQVLQNLVQTEQQARQLRNQQELMAMQQGGQAAIQQARLDQAAREAQATRDLTMWGKQGDWNRFDRQYATELEKARQNKMADFMKMIGMQQFQDQRNQASNQSRLDAARIAAGSRENVAGTNAEAKRYSADKYGETRQNVANTQLEGTRYTADARERTGQYAADSRERTGKYAADLGLQGRQYVADQSLKGNIYRADKELEGTLYRADQLLEGQRYTADQRLSGQQYTADQRLKGDQYSADQRLTGLRESNQAKENIARLGGGPKSDQNVLKMIVDLEKKRADILAKPAPKPDQMESMQRRAGLIADNARNNRGLSIKQIDDYIERERAAKWNGFQQRAVSEIDARLKELRGMGAESTGQPQGDSPGGTFAPIGFGIPPRQEVSTEALMRMIGMG